MKLELIATNQADSNEGGGIRIVDMYKLPAIYRELRKKAFTTEPLQQSPKKNPLIISGQYYPFFDIGNYGWQLFKTSEGIAMLEYIRGYSKEAGIRPMSLEEDTSLINIEITFHQEEEAYHIAKDIIDEQTKLAESRLRKTG